MKAVNYQGAFKVKVEDVPMPKIEHPDDVIVKITTSGKFSISREVSMRRLSANMSTLTTAICGSDLHMV